VIKAKRPKDLIERMKRVAAQQTPGEEGLPTAPPPPAEAPEPTERKNVRITVDLNPEMHRLLKVYASNQEMKVSKLVWGLIEELREQTTTPSAGKMGFVLTAPRVCHE